MYIEDGSPRVKVLLEGLLDLQAGFVGKGLEFTAPYQEVLDLFLAQTDSQFGFIVEIPKSARAEGEWIPVAVSQVDTRGHSSCGESDSVSSPNAPLLISLLQALQRVARSGTSVLLDSKDLTHPAFGRLASHGIGARMDWRRGWMDGFGGIRSDLLA